MTFLPILMLLLGCAIGAVVGYLIADRVCTALRARLAAAQEGLVEQRSLLDDAQARLRQAFASVSAEALAKNNEAFLHLAKEKFATLSAEATGSLDQRKAQIEGLLKPMQEILAAYQSRLGDIEKSRVESYSMLREQLGILTETQRTLNLQTHQLVSALRRPTTRGRAALHIRAGIGRRQAHEEIREADDAFLVDRERLARVPARVERRDRCTRFDVQDRAVAIERRRGRRKDVAIDGLDRSHALE